MVTPLGDYWFNRDERGQWIHSSMNAEGFSQHDPASEVKRKVPADVWSGYFKFSIARNPWDRVVSLFSWEARNRPALKPARRFYHRLGVPFDEFRETKRIFQDFVAGDWKTNDRFYLIDGELCVDFIVRYEHLDEDLGRVCARVGLPALALPHLKGGLRKEERTYVDYYDDASRQIVAQRHENDIRLFRYEFQETAEQLSLRTG
jgi:hypothetical protein